MTKETKYFQNWNVIAGPCAAESLDQIIESAKNLKDCGADILRAGVWKPRTNPNNWQGVGEESIDWLIQARDKTNISIATEVRDRISLEKILSAKFDYIWVGSRNGQNYTLLEEVGKLSSETKTPIILKRSMSASLNEWLGAAEYITRYNQDVILCERGIRGYSEDTRNILDIQTAWLAKQKSGLPVIVDVSHAAGRVDLIIPMSKAVKAAGFNGLMVEVHPDPVHAKTDSQQQINFKEFEILIREVNKITN